MSTFVLIHGGGSSAWDWHLVAPLLQQAEHDVVAVDLPIEDEKAGLEEYVDVVAAAVKQHESVEGHEDIIVVGHSLGGFTAPLVAAALNADGLVYLSSMIPAPGEAFTDWWTNTGHDREAVDADPEVVFFNGVPGDLAREAREREREEKGDWFSRPWPAERYPDVRTGAILCRDDQFFPPSFMRRQIRDRLGVEPVEIAGGHYAAISNPSGVAAALDSFARNAAP